MMQTGYSIERWKEMYAPNAAMLRHILVAEGYSVLQWCDGPGTEYGSHHHNDDQSHWVISGSIEFTIENDRTYVLEAGDRDIMPAFTIHKACVVSEGPVVYLIGSRARQAA